MVLVNCVPCRLMLSAALPMTLASVLSWAMSAPENPAIRNPPTVN